MNYRGRHTQVGASKNTREPCLSGCQMANAILSIHARNVLVLPLTITLVPGQFTQFSGRRDSYPAPTIIIA